MKQLSILICTVNGRESLLERLMTVLNDQLILNNYQDKVEILINKDDRELKTGSKRNILLEQSTGKYLSFIDDDDLVPDYYMEKILNIVENKEPDVIGINGIITFAGENPRKFIHSLKYNNWFERDNIYYRCPNHLNPVKREIALQVRYEDIIFGEDIRYSKKMFPLLKTEEYIEETMYSYLYREPLNKPKPKVINKPYKKQIRR